MSLVFDGASAGTLRALSSALRSGQLSVPLSPLAVARVAPGAASALTDELVRLSAEGMRADHMAVLLDTMARGVESHLASRAELVWTGPESSYAQSRDTAIVVNELFKSATRSVLVSTYVLKQPDKVFAALAAQMVEVPGLKVQIFAHVGRVDRDERHDSELLREYAAWLGREWPGPVRPAVYYDPRSHAGEFEHRATWHAKVVVVDDELSFVTSANFTEWAQQRNVEAGALIRSADFARQLRHQFESLIQSRAVLEIPGFRSA